MSSLIAFFPSFSFADESNTPPANNFLLCLNVIYFFCWHTGDHSTFQRGIDSYKFKGSACLNAKFCSWFKFMQLQLKVITGLIMAVLTFQWLLSFSQHQTLLSMLVKEGLYQALQWRFYEFSSNPLLPLDIHIRMQILYHVLYTLLVMVTRRVCGTVKSFNWECVPLSDLFDLEVTGG